jgi:hypothetical protein
MLFIKGAANRLLTKIQPKALGALIMGEKDAERRPKLLSKARQVTVCKINIAPIKY